MPISRNVVVFTLNPPEWRWFERQLGTADLRWHFVHATAPRWLGPLLRRPVFGQIAGGFRAAWRARQLDADLVIAVDPRAALWYSIAATLLRPRCKVLAYGFNFPILPAGLKHRVMTWAFRRPYRFIVFSTVELELYARYFDIPASKFEMQRWAVGTPRVGAEEILEPGSYVCAIGGNARDYRTLFEAARLLPHVPVMVVARPENLAGLDAPSNVSVRCNIPNPAAMRLLADSRFMALPLRDAVVPCGHVTLVAAMHLGKASVVTGSAGVMDYVTDGVSAALCLPNDARSMADSIDSMWQDEAASTRMGRQAKAFAEEFCSEETAIAYLRSMLTEEGLLHAES